MSLVVRMDLKMGRGKIAAQCSHAAVSAYASAAESKPSLVHKWMACGQPKVALKAANLEEIALLKEAAEDAGLLVCVVRDAGHTQVPSGSVTVLSIGPGLGSVVDRVTGHLKLL